MKFSIEPLKPLPSKKKKKAKSKTNIDLNDFNAVLDDLRIGKPTTRSLRDRNLNIGAFYAFIESTPDLMSKLHMAQELCAEALADEIIEISDTEPNPFRARNRIDARRWYASKIKPSKFADRLDVNLHQVIDITSVLNEARERCRLGDDQGKITELQPSDFKEITDEKDTGKKPITSKSLPEKVSITIDDLI